MFFLTWSSVCFSEESDKIKFVIEKIKSADKMPFEQITAGGKTYKYRLFQRPINLTLSEINGLPIKHNVSPLYTWASLESLIGNVTLLPKDRLNTILQFWEDRDTALKNLQNIYGSNEKDMCNKIIDEYNKTFCIAEFRKDDKFALIIFQDKMFPYPEFDPDGEPFVPTRPYFSSVGGYIKNNRYYFDDMQEFEKSESFSFTVLSISENELWRKFVLNNPYFKPPDPPPKDTWHKWETFLKDYEVEGEFVYFDGEFVTIMKRDGTKEKIKYKKLSIKDQFYVDKEVEEQKKRYEKELKELPEQLAKEPFHEWITKIHDYKIEGEFINYDGKIVTIKKRDGKIEQIEYNRLSLDDKNYIQEKLLQRKKNNQKNKRSRKSKK
jgi:hypothetical protein